MSRTAARPHSRRAPTTAHARGRVAPPPRRVSGPSARGGAVALPAPARGRGSTGAFERVLRLPDHRMVDRLLRSRAWIWLVGILLGGIVAMQVSLLKLNTGISRAVEASATLQRQNADLEGDIARLSSSERTRTQAESQGMIMPPAGEVSYLTARAGTDASRAVARMRPPSDAARQLLANRGITPGSLAAGPSGAGTSGGPASTSPGSSVAGANGAGSTGSGSSPDGAAGTGTSPAATGTGASGAGTSAGGPAGGGPSGASTVAGGAPAGGATGTGTSGASGTTSPTATAGGATAGQG